MNIKALIKSLLLRKFATSLLLLQLALTLALLVNSGILAWDTHQKLNEPLGIAGDELAIIDYVPTAPEFDDEAYYLSIIEQDLARIRAIDGVKSVAPANQKVVQWGGWNSNVHDVNNPDAEKQNKQLRYVAEFYSNHELAQTLGVKLIAGRYLTEADSWQGGKASDDRSIVVTESLAKALYGEQSALGQLTNRGRIVGVVADFKVRSQLPLSQQYALFTNHIIASSRRQNHFYIRVEPSKLSSVQLQLRDTLMAVHSDRDINDILTMKEHLEFFYNQDIGLSKLFAMLCGLMMFVTMISSYAHAQFHLTKQKKLIGIRRALGARKSDILIYVLSENWLLSCLAILLGFAAMLGINLLLSQWLSISKPNTLLFFGASFSVLVSASIATLLPAWQTSKIAPVIATRTV